MFVGSFIYYSRQHLLRGGYFVLCVLGIAYIFSSWWIWTYGGGLGQRPMIDFYPFITLGFAGFLQNFQRMFQLSLLFVPLMMLNLVHAFQINKYILVGGKTTWGDYKTHFLQLKRTAPEVEIDRDWKLLSQYKTLRPAQLDGQKHYSDALEISEIVNQTSLVVRLQVKGKHESSALALVVSDTQGQYYFAQYLGNVLYSQARVLAYRFDLPQNIQAPLRVYLWNSDTDEKAQLDFMEVDVYSTRSESNTP
jgi:hypothetical protein